MTNILDVPLRGNDADAETIGEYLGLLLCRVWDEEQGFSGKRPWGNSGWQYVVYVALAEAGFIEGERDVYDEGGPDEYVDYNIEWNERRRADGMIMDAIKEKFGQ